jgi:hypothetical protein
MPQPKWFGDKLLAAVQDGQVSQETITMGPPPSARAFRSPNIENPTPQADESIIRSDATGIWLSNGCGKHDLLKNDKFLRCQKTKIKTIALIGPSAKVAALAAVAVQKVKPWHAVVLMKA